MKKLCKGFVYYLLSSLIIGIMLMCYLPGNPVAEIMDFTGWVFFITSCIAQASLFCLIPFIIFYIPFTLSKLPKAAASLMVGSVSLIAIMAFVNLQVYKIYRFHINGFVISLLTAPEADEIFDFDTKLILTELALFATIIAVCIALWFGASRLAKRINLRSTLWCIGGLAFCALTANCIHIYGAFVVKPSVIQTARLVPYYFPLSASRFMESLGVERNVLDIDASVNGSGDLVYPQKPIETDTITQSPHIILLLIDSWSKLSLTEECMPRMWNLAHQEQWYDNHVSCSNGTRYSIFGMFTSLQPYYYSAFESARMSPVMIDRLLELGYDFRAYPSASIEAPPFHRILFNKVENLRTTTPGETSFDRDMQIKKDFIADLPKIKESGQPTFSFIFFDLLHAYSLPKNLLNRFQPSWEYGDFTKLNNDMDPTPFWNLYRNSAYQTDIMVDEIIAALKENDMYDNSLIFITGDHAQEYNENKKNYWGHGSNFSTYQVGVPLIAHIPGKEQAAKFMHRTTHYDFVPTIMHNYLGVRNDIADYSVGKLLNDSTDQRLWHFVGNELKYAFLVENDTILTKEGSGWLEVTDAKLKPIENYNIKIKEFDTTIKQLNRFFK